jgi:hypothetical protein
VYTLRKCIFFNFLSEAATAFRFHKQGWVARRECEGKKSMYTARERERDRGGVCDLELDM